MRSEDRPKASVSAFIEQVQIDVTEGWQEPVRVTAVNRVSVRKLETKAIPQWHARSCDKNRKHPLPETRHEPLIFINEHPGRIRARVVRTDHNARYPAHFYRVSAQIGVGLCVFCSNHVAKLLRISAKDRVAF
jgi:hypothetical protein